jgi:GMP synthase-like glutamine amidotransferase
MDANRDSKSMQWSCLQHVPFEGPGYLAKWCQRRGFPLTCIELWKSCALPAPDEFDGLFILGGPMNVYEDAKYPWLVPEKDLIARAISDRKPILGVCLGAQLLAVVLGGSVTEMLGEEIGWFPVELTSAGRNSNLFRGFADEFMAFHWHADSFSIPPHAVHVAQSDGCDEQAFVYENHVIGLQFHLESSEHTIGALIEHCGDDIGCGRYIQDPDTILSGANHIRDAHVLLTNLLDNLISTSKAPTATTMPYDRQQRTTIPARSAHST